MRGPWGARWRAARRAAAPGWRRRLYLVGIVAAVLAVLSAVGDRGALRLYRLARTRADLQQEIARLKEGNRQLAEEARALRQDPSRLEGIARRDLGLVRPGETVYDFRGAPPEGGGKP